MQSFFASPAKLFGRCAAVWLALIMAVSAFADNSKISPDLQALLSNPSNKLGVIVQYNTPVPSTAANGLVGGLLGEGWWESPWAACSRRFSH